MTTRDSISSQAPLPQSMSQWQQLKQQTLSVETIRQIDRMAIERFHMHSLVLMENAAINCTQSILFNWQNWKSMRAGQLHRGAATATSSVSNSLPTCVLLCGRGNNGGDGLAIARHLSLAGWHCTVFQLGPIDRLSSDALANWRILNTTPTNADKRVSMQPGSPRCLLVDNDQSSQQLKDLARLLQECDVVIDAMLGSGAQGKVRAPLDHWIRLANQSPAVRVAIDIPTGLDATTGIPSESTFHADATLTFVARKPGFAKATALEHLGQLEVLPIGIPVQMVEELLEAALMGTTVEL